MVTGASKGAPPCAPVGRYTWVALAVIVALAAAWRVSALQRAGPLPGRGDAVEYDIIATTLLERDEFRTPAHGLPHGEYAVRTPGYPAFLAALYWAGERGFGSKFALVRPVQCVLDLGTLLLVFVLVRRLLGRRAALVAALLYAAYPGFWWAASSLYTETVTTFLWAGAVLVLTLGFEQRRARAFIVAGLILGVAALVRPTGQAFAVFLLIALVWTYRPRNLRWLWHSVAFAIAVGVVLSPWAVRNYRVFHRPVGLSSFGGLNFWAGNYVPFRGRFRAASYPMVRRITAAATDEFHADGALSRAAWQEIGDHLVHRPGAYAVLLWDKFHTFWSPYHSEVVVIGWGSRGITGAGLHKALLLLGLVGVLVASLSGRRYAPMLAAIAFVNIVHVATIAEEGRYNLVVMPYVIVLATAALGWLFPHWLGAREDTAVPPSAPPL